MQSFLRILSLAFTLLFLFFAAVQCNDPDWPVWIYAYLLPAYISISASRGKFNKVLIVAVGIAALLGTLTFFPYGHFEGVAVKDGMKTIEIELARESLGLGIILIVMILHFVQAHVTSRGIQIKMPEN